VFAASHFRPRSSPVVLCALGDLRVQSALLSFAFSTSFSSFNSFRRTSLAAPHPLTPIKSHRYTSHRGALLSSRAPRLAERGAPSLEFTLRKGTPVTSLESTLVEVFILIDLKSFRNNTYEKHRGEGVLLLTRNPRKARALRPGGDHEVPVAGNFYPEEHRDERSLRVAQPLLAVLFHRSRLTGHGLHSRADTHSRLALLSLRADSRGISTNHV
jgi:hypothetical protein